MVGEEGGGAAGRERVGRLVFSPLPLTSRYVRVVAMLSGNLLSRFYVCVYIEKYVYGWYDGDMCGWMAQAYGCSIMPVSILLVSASA
jgi:hypothetical protein